MKPEEAYAILEAMAEIHDCKENLKLVVPSDIEAQEEQLEQEIDTESHEKRRIFLLRNVRFLLEKKLNIMRIQVLRARLLGTEKWSIKGKKYSITGPGFFKHKGEWLNDIRARIGF